MALMAIFCALCSIPSCVSSREKERERAREISVLATMKTENRSSRTSMHLREYSENEYTRVFKTRETFKIFLSGLLQRRNVRDGIAAIGDVNVRDF